MVCHSTILLLAFEARHFAELTYVGYHSPTSTPAWAIGKDVYRYTYTALGKCKTQHSTL